MKIVVLASGSKGNATYLKTPNTSILIDAGISYRQMKLRLQDHHFDVTNLSAVLVTHEHSDHVRGLTMLMKMTDVTLYTPTETFDFLGRNPTMALPLDRFQPIEAHQSFWISDIKITPIPISHDASNTIGFIIEYNGKKIVYMTDIGYLPKTDYPHIMNADMYVFEANYDVSLLFSSERPYYLKKRIDSVKGHMSNADSAYHLTQLVGSKTKTIVLVHPSLECNTPYHVLETFESVFESYSLSLELFDIVIAQQNQTTKVIEL